MKADPALERLGRVSAELLSGEVTPEVDAAGRARLVSAIALSRPRRGGWLFAAALVGAAGGGAVLFARSGAPTAGHEGPGFTVNGAAVTEARWVRAGEQPATLQFREGSTLVLASRASVRVIAASEDGAEVLVEAGSAHVRVAHHDGTRWTVRAGPYTLHVTGTEFDVGWEPGSEVLRVDLREGGLEVVGPAPGGMVRLGAGQVLEGRPDGLSVRSPSALPSSAVPSAVPSALASALPAGEGAPAASPSPLASAPGASWAKLVAAGSFKTVLDEADSRGVDGVLSGAGAADLLALADAARYGRRGDLAARALEALRRRFPGSREAGTATFLLARAADDGGKTSRALELFDAYLSSFGGGAFAAEALGRKMLALQRAGRANEARVAATQYLARHPKGSHAQLARGLAGDAP